jgi:threonine/homoserine efflux transporter RhtA
MVQNLRTASLGLLLAALCCIGQADAGHLAATRLVGILARVVPFLIYNAVVARVTATSAELTLSLVPLFGTLASLLLLDEGLSVAPLAGGAFVVTAATGAARA